MEWPGKAQNARDYISSERILEVECGIKVKVGSRCDMRNGIPQRNPGDKIYANVDYSPGFFSQEGIIPGSCIQDRRRHNKATISQATHSDGGDGVNFRPQLSYEAKKRAQLHQGEVHSVESLPS